MDATNREALTSRPVSERSDPDEILTTVTDTELPEPVAALADEYEQLIGIHDRFVWKWIYTLLPEFTLDCVPPDAAPPARISKTILTLFITTLDDIIEHEKVPC